MLRQLKELSDEQGLKGTAAAHTYDVGYEKWRKYDGDEAGGENGEEEDQQEQEEEEDLLVD
jgi:hypothetical protein